MSNQHITANWIDELHAPFVVIPLGGAPAEGFKTLCEARLRQKELPGPPNIYIPTGLSVKVLRKGKTIMMYGYTPWT